VLEVLLLLAEQPGRRVPKADIINKVWGDVVVEPNALHRCIRQLRKAFRILASSERFGMAPLYGLIYKPELFQAIITISSWITDDSGLLSDFETFLKENNNNSAFLWLSSCDGLREVENYNKLLTLLEQQAPKTLDWKSTEFKRNTNMSQYLVSLPSALAALG